MTNGQTKSYIGILLYRYDVEFSLYLYYIDGFVTENVESYDIWNLKRQLGYVMTINDDVIQEIIGRDSRAVFDLSTTS